ncbi:carboxypeptidase Y homolog A [Striga asiatica]|uniref:Carboxypeptidase Y homolog A n=1 Tax=Striga asiatica TaxID=4170 RepID=A0A5A7QQH3_STRAF|nr:carboxypeptidase Y homolog A [Striga asiatica]
MVAAAAVWVQSAGGSEWRRAEGRVRCNGESASSAEEGLVGVDSGRLGLCRRVTAVAQGHDGRLVRAQGRRLLAGGATVGEVVRVGVEMALDGSVCGVVGD